MLPDTAKPKGSKEKYEARRRFGKEVRDIAKRKKTKKKYEARRTFGKKVRDTAKRKKPKKEVRGTAKVRQRSTRHGEGTQCPQIPSLILELPKVHGHRSADLEPKGGSFLSKRPMQTADLEFTKRIRRIRRMKRIADTARRSEPGNRAHAFRMTLVAQGKLPQINGLPDFPKK